MRQTKEKLWGTLDTVDRVWLGDDDGPTLDTDKTIADVRAMMADAQFGHPVGRHRARRWRPGPMRLRDHKAIVLGAEAALKRLEEGYA